MFELDTAIDIDAAPERVWAVLTDFAAYPQWNPFVREVRGAAERGARLVVTVQSAGGKPMSFRPTVRAAEPARELRWLGRVLLPGLFDGEHRFLIEPLAADHSRFHHGERFSGVLVPLLRRSLESDTRQGFKAMNEALKRRAESSR